MIDVQTYNEHMQALATTLNELAARVRQLEAIQTPTTLTYLRLAQDVTNVSDPPLDAELDAIFGTPATLGRGFIASLDDNDANTDVYLVWTSDASWYWVKGTKAL